MSIHFISGKPGGGKSLFALKLIIDELCDGHRHIVTNMALRLDELNAYLQGQKMLLPDVHIRDRVTIIEEEDLKQFYRFRGNKVFLPVRNEGLWEGQNEKSAKKTTLVADFSKVSDTGVFYVLDEIHVAFNARQWAATGEGVLYYLSQHRKLGDTVLLITQSVQNVDRQMRSVAQDFTYLRNMRKEKVGLFKLPGIFMKRTFLEPATGTVKPIQTSAFRLDLRIANCYDTAAGVGILGKTGGDVSEKRTGLPWWVFVVGVVVLIIGIVQAAPAVVEWGLKPAGIGGSKSVGKAGASAASSLPGLKPGQAEPQAEPQQVQKKEQEPNAIKVSGFVARMDKVTWWVFYSDGGSEIVPKSELILRGRWVEVYGRRYELATGKEERHASANLR